MEDTTDTVEVADTEETRDQGQICRELGWRLALQLRDSSYIGVSGDLLYR